MGTAPWDVLFQGQMCAECFRNEAVAMYNGAIETARTESDNASRELFERLLKDEEEHVDFLEAQVHQMKEVGYERYLSQQINGGE